MDLSPGDPIGSCPVSPSPAWGSRVPRPLREEAPLSSHSNLSPRSKHGSYKSSFKRLGSLCYCFLRIFFRTNTTLDFEVYLRKKAKFSADVLLSISEGHTGLTGPSKWRGVVGTAVLGGQHQEAAPRPARDWPAGPWDSGQLRSSDPSGPPPSSSPPARQGPRGYTPACWPLPEQRTSRVSSLTCSGQRKMGPWLKTRTAGLLG